MKESTEAKVRGSGGADLLVFVNMTRLLWLHFPMCGRIRSKNGAEEATRREGCFEKIRENFLDGDLVDPQQGCKHLRRCGAAAAIGPFF